MFDRTKVLTELDAQRVLIEERRCLIEAQQVQIQKQIRRIEVQAQVTATIQAEFDALKRTLRPAPQQTPRHGNGEDRTARRSGRETASDN